MTSIRERSWRTGAAVLVAAGVTCSSAWGQPASPGPAAPALPGAARTAGAEPPAALFGKPVDAQRLGRSRGGASTSVSTDIGGVLRDNSASQVQTGANAIRDGSFANAVGFNTVIQNTGANVLIQNSMTVNVQFK